MKTRKVAPKSKLSPSKQATALPLEDAFAEVVGLIREARTRAYQAVNTELVGLYWQVGKYISKKLETAEWGEGVVDQLAGHLAQTLPGLRGFTRRNLFRMRQFYEAYRRNEIVTPLVTQLPWTHNLIILSQSKRPEEREFYLRMAIRERWGKRELEKQFRQALFERAVLHPPKVSPAVRQIHGDAADSLLKDSYFFEFLDLPVPHAEDDLQRGLLAQLKEFLIELGRDFCFVGSEYPVQVGGRDFALDLLREFALAAINRNSGRHGQVGFSLRCPGFGGQVHPCRFAVVTLLASEFRHSSSFLAIRRLGYTARTISGGGGLSCPLEPRLRPRRPHCRPACCLFYRRMAAPRRSQRLPGGLLQTRPHTTRAPGCPDRGLDFGDQMKSN